MFRNFSRVNEFSKYEDYAMGMIEWIYVHGSEHLKKLMDLDYMNEKVTEMYLSERAAKEFPSSTVASVDTKDWSSVELPTHKALKIQANLLRKGLKSKVKYVDKELEVVVVENYGNSKSSLLTWG